MMYNCLYKLIQVLNFPSAKVWHPGDSYFKIWVTYKYYSVVGISFSKQNCFRRHVTVFNLSTATCISTNSNSDDVRVEYILSNW